MTWLGFLSVPGHRHCQPCRASPPFFRPFSVPPLVTAFTLRKALKIKKRSVFLFSAPQVSACGVLLSQCWFVFFLVGMVASTCGGVRGSLSVAFFGWWILPHSSALGAGLPGLPGACSIELLPPSQSGCVQLPLLFITPFACLVFLENFGFVGVDGVFGSGF